MFYLPVYYLSAAFFIFVWLVGFIYGVEKCVEVLGCHVSWDVTASDIRRGCYFLLFVLLGAIVAFKWVVLSGGPGISVYRILSTGGSRVVAYPVFIFSMILTGVGGIRFAFVLWRSLRKSVKKVSVVPTCAVCDMAVYNVNVVCKRHSVDIS